MLCWLNGTLLPIEEARVPVLDRGFLYGDSLFETVRVRYGVAVRLQRHLARLKEGLHSLHFPLLQADLEAAAQTLIQAEGLQEGVLRMAVSRGQGTRGALPLQVHSPTLLITLGPLPPDLERRQQQGVRLCTSPWRKPRPDMLPNHSKLGNYLNSILAMQSVAESGADEALLLDAQGDVAECSSSNLFMANGGELVTPWLESGALAGITRTAVIELASNAGIKVSERRLSMQELRSAEEVFMTNAVVGIAPVAAWDDVCYQVHGPLTRSLRHALE